MKNRHLAYQFWSYFVKKIDSGHVGAPIWSASHLRVVCSRSQVLNRKIEREFFVFVLKVHFARAVLEILNLNLIYAFRPPPSTPRNDPEALLFILSNFCILKRNIEREFVDFMKSGDHFLVNREKIDLRLVGRRFWSKIVLRFVCCMSQVLNRNIDRALFIFLLKVYFACPNLEI